MRAKNVVELLKILHSNSALLSAIFDSNGRQMNINSAIGMSNSDTISFLEDYGIIEIFNNEVILDDQIIHMLEAHLIDGYAKQLENHKESNITQHSLLKAFLPKNTIKELHRYKKWKYKIGQTHI